MDAGHARTSLAALCRRFAWDDGPRKRAVTGTSPPISCLVVKDCQYAKVFGGVSPNQPAD